ncbi:hypothetical protein JKP88DRAFT_246904 [Tribonema minus]|uniref:Uncharacterized protein n=1 Tax=Tribonema minus TaxID=303371 RepID=A0A836CCR1_9STRA|nr:hypothetical protein JKP88DRAFT_246904 [Tribonema minus]
MLSKWVLPSIHTLQFKDAPIQRGGQLVLTLPPSEDINPAVLADVFSFITTRTLPRNISSAFLRQLHYFGMEQPSHLPPNYFTHPERNDLEYDARIFIHRLINTDRAAYVGNTCPSVPMMTVNMRCDKYLNYDRWGYEADAYKYVMAYPDILREQGLIKFGLNIVVGDCTTTQDTCVAVDWGRGEHGPLYDLEYRLVGDTADEPHIATLRQSDKTAIIDGYTIKISARRHGNADDGELFVKCELPEELMRQRLFPITVMMLPKPPGRPAGGPGTTSFMLHHGLLCTYSSLHPYVILLSRAKGFSAQHFSPLKDLENPSEFNPPRNAVAITLKLV